MDHTENLTNCICQCRNSIKLRILEIVNSYSKENKPIIMENLIQIIYDIIIKENKHIVIDENFLKTYIRSITSEMIDSNLIRITSIKLFVNDKKDDDIIYYVQLDSEKLTNFLFFIRESENKNFLINNCSDEVNSVNPSDKKSPDDSLNTSNPSNVEIPKNEIEKDKLNNLELKNKLIDEIISLRNNLEKLKKDNKTKILHNEIHRYNEIKDVGQELLGYIASNKGMRIKELYEEMGISDDENK